MMLHMAMLHDFVNLKVSSKFGTSRRWSRVVGAVFFLSARPHLVYARDKIAVNKKQKKKYKKKFTL